MFVRRRAGRSKQLFFRFDMHQCICDSIHFGAHTGRARLGSAAGGKQKPMKGTGGIQLHKPRPDLVLAFVSAVLRGRSILKNDRHVASPSA